MERPVRNKGAGAEAAAEVAAGAAAARAEAAAEVAAAAAAAAAVAVAPCVFSPEVLLRLADLVGLETKPEAEKIAKATEIISELDQTKTSPDYFSKLLGTLPRIALKPSTHANSKIYSNLVKTNDSLVNTIKTKEIGRGTFGAVYESIPIGANVHGGYAYKFIAFEDERKPDVREEQIRGIVLEAFIQLVLSMDPEKGSFVCGIHKIYCSGKDTLVIKLEYITESLRTHLTDVTPWPHVSALLESIHETIMYFRAKYGFHHRDFHSGNVMMKGGGIKLIDFGEACITCGSKTFSLHKEGPAQKCESADMLILVASLYEYGGLSQGVRMKLMLLLGDALYEFRATDRLDEWFDAFPAVPDGKAKRALQSANKRLLKEYYDERWEALDNRPVFHRFYHYILNNPKEWKDDLDASIDRSAIARDLLDKYDQTFLDRLRAIPAAGGRRTRRGKGTSRRQTRRRR